MRSFIRESSVGTVRRTVRPHSAAFFEICHLKSEIANPPLPPMTRVRKLSRSLNRHLNRACTRHTTRMLGGARRPPRPNELRNACRLLDQALRIRKRMTKRDPHLFGPHAHRYYLDTLRLAQQQQEARAALAKVYGPSPPGAPDCTSTVWADRYVFRTPEQHRRHLRWFKEQYGKG
jgi:hypothetical protein